MSLAVLAPGWASSVQDLGRRGHAAIGVGGAGAMDAVALRLANALVGNPGGAAALELTLRGPRLRCTGDALIALTGAPLEATCGGRAVPMWRPLFVRGGSELEFGAMTSGARSYLAIDGGIDVAPVLGSRSTDVNAALGPCGGRALLAGDVLAAGERPATVLAFANSLATRCGADGAGSFVAASWSLDPAPWFDDSEPHLLALIRGAHWGSLDGASQKALFTAEFRVGNESNRVGYRLAGPQLKLRSARELVSEGVVPGTMQLPPSGEPIVLMAEAPTTGGYPRIGHVATVDLPRLGQCRPGDRVRFVEISLADAQSRYLERERKLAILMRNVGDRLVRP